MSGDTKLLPRNTTGYALTITAAVATTQMARIGCAAS